MIALKTTADYFFNLTADERMQMINKLHNIYKFDYEDIRVAFNDFYADMHFHQHILNKRLQLYLKTGIPDYGMGKELLPLYIIIRLLKPKQVVETGIGYGSSTAYILKALDDNSRGILTSIGVPYLFEDSIGVKKAVLVSDEFKNRWEYIEGYTWDNLKKFHGDLFLHDSDHCAEYMHWELSQAKKCFKYIIAHDAADNRAFAQVFNTEDSRFDILIFNNQMPINAQKGSLGVAYVDRIKF